MVKISRNSMVIRRVTKLKTEIKIDTQDLREKALKGLEELFDLARDMATSGNIKLKQRQIWARIAAYIAQIINGVASGFDERQINADFDELERLINEARAKTETGKTEEGAAGARENTASQGSS